MWIQQKCFQNSSFYMGTFIYQQYHNDISIFCEEWTQCATITTSDNHENYLELIKCPQTSGYKQKLEENIGVCYQNAYGWVDWEYPNDHAQKSLGYYLDTWPHGGWIQPAAPGYLIAARSIAVHDGRILLLLRHIEQQAPQAP